MKQKVVIKKNKPLHTKIYFVFIFLYFTFNITSTAQKDENLAKYMDSILDANYEMSLKNPGEAIEKLKGVLEYSEKEKDSITSAKAYMNISFSYILEAKYHKAYESLVQADLLIDPEKKPILAAMIKNTIAYVFKNFRLNKYVLKYCNEGLEYLKDNDSLKNSRMYPYLIINIAAITRDYEPEKTLIEIEKLILETKNNTALSPNEKEFRIGLCNIEKSMALLKAGKIQEALKLCEYQVAIYESKNYKSRPNEETLASGYLYLAEMHNVLHNTDTALDYALKAYDMILEYKLLDFLRDVNQLLANLYEQKNQFQNALYHTKKRDSLNETLNEQQEVWAMFEKEFHLNQLEKRQTKELSRKEAAFSSTKIKLYLLITIIIIASLIYIVFQQKKKHKKENEYRAQLQTITEEQLKKTREVLELKKRKLTTAALQIVENGEKLKSIKSQLNHLKNNIDSKHHRQIDNLSTSIALNTKKDWEEFKSRFEQVNENFFNNLKKKHPNLTPNDLKLCSFLKLNFNSKDIANLMNISVDSVKVSRHRIRKKLHLDKGENLVHYIDEF